MKRRLLASLALAALLSPLAAHEGHKEAGAFNPPHGGAFAKFAGHWVEFYLEGGQARLCMYEAGGELTTDEHSATEIALKISGKGLKPVTLRAAGLKGGCAGWSYGGKARVLRAELSARVGGKLAKARLNLEMKAK